MNHLEGLAWQPAWITHLGCHLGCLDYLGLKLSRARVFGGTSHAFALNIHEQLCPSGPTAWKTEVVDRLAENLGYLVDGVVGAHKSHSDFEARQAIAWALVRGCIDTGVPCYGWELHMAEWYVITGYDDVGYFYSGPGAEHGPQPKPWRELAETEIGWLSVQCVLPCEAADDDVAVRAALTAALEHAAGEYCHDNYVCGPQAFEVWAAALESGRADRFGAGYNGACWLECRQMAVAFLDEARERLPGRADALFAEAATHYAEVVAALTGAVRRVPFELPVEGTESDERAESDEGATVQDAECAKLLREAGAAEVRGLDAIERLVDEL